MREIKLRMQVMGPLASGARGGLPLVGGVCWGVTAGKASHNAGNARGVTAGNNIIEYNIIVYFRHYRPIKKSYIRTSWCKIK